ncbi:MAG: nucleoside deaminase [Pseudomonadota bacterium]
MVFTSYMNEALEEARQAANLGEVPVGAVVVLKRKIISRAHNRTKSPPNAIAHAELLALQAAMVALEQERLEGCDMYVTLEPCPMCASAISHARIRRLYIGASDPKSGGVLHGPRVFDHSQAHHKPEIYQGHQEAACAALLRDFFESLRG